MLKPFFSLIALIGILPIGATQSDLDRSFEDNITLISGYRFKHWKHDEGRLMVLNRHGKVVFNQANSNVWGWNVGDLDGDKNDDAVIATWSGGAHAEFTYSVISLGKKPRTLLSFDMGNGGGEDDLKFIDLNGDGKKEIVSVYDGYCYNLGVGYGYTQIPIIFELRNGRYEERTSAFRKYITKSANLVFGWLKSDIKAKATYTNGFRIGAVEYWSRMTMIGKEVEAWSTLKGVLPGVVYKDLYANKKWLHTVLNARKDRVGYPSIAKLPYHRRTERPSPFEQ